ncbi:hypothetical protein TWF730_007378 [Orbilia blumenaviensis]|uniref:Uncharacterized protein n=1 Tax=Orbilia blumenaviensis TaxID=1796055 RepID=A0AAV9V9X9_9PEZI
MSAQAGSSSSGAAAANNAARITISSDRPPHITEALNTVDQVCNVLRLNPEQWEELTCDLDVLFSTSVRLLMDVSSTSNESRPVFCQEVGDILDRVLKPELRAHLLSLPQADCAFALYILAGQRKTRVRVFMGPELKAELARQRGEDAVKGFGYKWSEFRRYP